MINGIPQQVPLTGGMAPTPDSTGLPLEQPPSDLTMPVDPAMVEQQMGVPAPPSDPKKKPLIMPANVAHQMARAYADKVVEMATLVATQSGPPDGAVPYSTAKQVRMWRAWDPTVNVGELRANGTSETEITRQVYPLREVLLKLAGRMPLEKVRYAQHMKRTAANYIPAEGEDETITDDERETLAS